MLEGFWLVHAEGPGGTSGGVVVFANGKIFGGDSGFYYVGTYQHQDGTVKARVAVHNFDPAIVNILSVAKDYELDVSATVKDNSMSGTAVVPGVANQSIALKLTKKANL
jgi:hypothetical protein